MSTFLADCCEVSSNGYIDLDNEEAGCQLCLTYGETSCMKIIRKSLSPNKYEGRYMQAFIIISKRKKKSCNVR